MDENLAGVIKVMFITGTVLISTIILVIAERRKAKPPQDGRLLEIQDRLTRIEQAVDTIAIEVERVSEGQRFTSKLLAERAEVPTRLPTKQITPH